MWMNFPQPQFDILTRDVHIKSAYVSIKKCEETA